jgi:glycosyltransferase involved in cell wall biosynthesis
MLMLAGPLFPQTLLEECVGPQEQPWLDYRGVLDRKGVAEVMTSCRAGIVLLPDVPAYLESLPVKMFEYMAAGLPVVASDFPIWREIVEGNDCGICVDHRDQSAIDEAIRVLLDDPARAEEMGRNGRRAVREKFTWKSTFSDLERVYDTVLGGA